MIGNIIDAEKMSVNTIESNDEALRRCQIIARLPRDPVNRSDANLTYRIERELLDACQIKEFHHRNFHLTNARFHAYVISTPNELLIGV